MPKTINIEIPRLGLTKINFFGISEIVYDNYIKICEFERQKKIPHLGVISKHINCAQHTRYDYLMLQLALVDLLEKLNRGTIHYSLGELSINGTKYKGINIIKSWLMLSNMGHSFTTISDEQYLQDLYIQRKKFRNNIAKIIDDNDVVNYFHEKILEYDYTSFHYILSYVKLKKFYAKDNDSIKKLIRLLFLDSINDSTINVEKLKKLRNIFSLIRKLSIVIIDCDSTHIPLQFDFLAYINSIDVQESILVNKKQDQILDHIIQYLYNEIYLNPYVVKYNEEHKNALIKKYNSEYNYTKIIHELSHKRDFTKKEIVNFLRIEFPDDLLSVHDIFSLNYIVKRRNDTHNIYSAINHCKYSKVILIDFMANMEPSFNDFLNIASKYYFHSILTIYELIGKVKEKSIKDFGESISFFSDYITDEEMRNAAIQKYYDDNYKTVFFKNEIRINDITAQIINSILRLILADNYYYDIANSDKRYFILEKDFDRNISYSMIDYFHEKEVDNDKKHEMMHFKNFIKRKNSGLRIAYFQRIDIYDKSQSPDKAIATDIDSLIIKITDDKIIIELFESKNQKRRRVTSACNDINTKMKKVFRKDILRGSRILKDEKFGARLRISI